MSILGRLLFLGAAAALLYADYQAFTVPAFRSALCLAVPVTIVFGWFWFKFVAKNL